MVLRSPSAEPLSSCSGNIPSVRFLLHQFNIEPHMLLHATKRGDLPLLRSLLGLAPAEDGSTAAASVLDAEIRKGERVLSPKVVSCQGAAFSSSAEYSPQTLVTTRFLRSAAEVLSPVTKILLFSAS
jgi:hypothetical protein